ncbi:hypothetical protein FI667_g1508, partial [Globisporangium splendens]
MQDAARQSSSFNRASGARVAPEANGRQSATRATAAGNNPAEELRIEEGSRPVMSDRPKMEERQEAIAETAQRRNSALQSTLGLASSAASLVLYPYVAAGKAAYQATSYAVHAPINITRHVKDSILGSNNTSALGASENEEQVATCDLFGEQSAGSEAESDVCEVEEATEASTATDDSADEVVDLFGEQDVPIIDTEQLSTEVERAEAESKSGVVSQLLFLPVRVVSRGVSTAAAIPGSLISYSGKKISGAVSTSQSLATTALVVSSGAVARTSLHVAQGLTYGAISTASFTATKLSGAVGTSVRSVGYVIPESVSNAVWQGMGATGNASVSVVSYAIAVPAYRMLDALIPDLSKYISERDCVERTREVVLLLVKVMGPQNAFYLLKFVYETVNSDEAYDMFLLCQDIVRESLDGENYRAAGSSVGKATGASVLVPVVTEIYNMMPSFEELFDAIAFVADVSGEILNEVAQSSSSNEMGTPSRFEYVDDSSNGEEDEGEDSESGHSTISVDAYDNYQHVQRDEEEDQEAQCEGGEIEFSNAFGTDFEPSQPASKASSSSSTTDQEENVFGFDFGVTSFLAEVCDSDEATALFNTFGDFLDVLVESK